MNYKNGYVVELEKENQSKLLNLLIDALEKEIIGVLRYKRQELAAKAIHEKILSFEFKRMASEGQIHVEHLARDLARQGKTPNFTPVGPIMKSHSDYVEGRSLPEMIKEDWVAEHMAIGLLSDILTCLNKENAATQKMLEQIIGFKEKQLKQLINLFSEFSPSANGEPSHPVELLVSKT